MSHTNKTQLKMFTNTLLILLILAVITYFTADIEWLVELMPDVIGFTIFGLIIAFAVRKNTKFTTFIGLMTVMLLLGIALWKYGLGNGSHFASDVAPEIVAVSSIAIVMSVLFRKKMMG